MRAIVLVDHGSRLETANVAFRQLAERVAAALPERSIRIAHLEIAKPSLPDAMTACVLEGATEIVVYPFFLGPGRHSANDIPECVDAAQRDHPEVAIRLVEPLGSNERIAELVIDSLR